VDAEPQVALVARKQRRQRIRDRGDGRHVTASVRERGRQQNRRHVRERAAEARAAATMPIVARN
jgi:hypothetical protein